MGGSNRARELREERDRSIVDLGTSWRLDSPRVMARRLKEEQGKSFYGLAVLLRETEQRIRFEQWVKDHDEGAIAKAVERAYRGRAARSDGERGRSLSGDLLDAKRQERYTRLTALSIIKLISS